MLELADAYGKDPLRLHEIAKKQQISVRYLERMMHAMVTAGLVLSTHGQYRGFTLSKSPDEIRWSQIVRVTEGSLSIVDCMDDPHICTRWDKCVTKNIWVKLTEAMENILESNTFHDIVVMQRNKTN